MFFQTTLRSRGVNQPEELQGPAHGVKNGSCTHSLGASIALSSRPGAAPEPAAGVEELRGLVEGYRGFGMFSLIRVLLFRGWRHCGLAVLALMLLIGQWAGRCSSRRMYHPGILAAAAMVSLFGRVPLGGISKRQ